MRLKYLFLLPLLFCSLATQAQKIKELIADAEVAFNQKDYKGAIIQLEKAVKQAGRKKEQLSIAWRLLGISNYRLGNYEASVEAYKQLFEIQPDFAKTAYYECAKAYMKVYKYDLALEYFLLYKNAEDRDYKMSDQTAQISYTRRLPFEIKNCRYARDFEYREEDLLEAENLGKNINSPADEYMPTLTTDGRLLIFTSTRKGDENILVSRLHKDSSSWSKAQSIGPAATTEMNEGQARLTSCGRTLYFAACNWENVAGGCDIFQARYDARDDALEQVEPSLGLNSDKWDSQPAISCDGQRMFFASSRPGGYGGTDLWMSKMGENGSWQEPVNLGASINTAGDEEAPFIAPDGQSLYFSSDGHPGFGDSDIFLSKSANDGQTWTKPQNLGPTINTPYREAGISLSPLGDKAYFASARPKGKGGLDIYKIYVPKRYRPEANLMFEGYVFDEENQKPIAGAQVQINQLRGEKRTVISDEEGFVFLCLQDSQSYSIIVNKEGYRGYIGAELLQSSPKEPVFRLKIAMNSGANKSEEPKEPVLRAKDPSQRIRKNLSVYFQSGQSELSEIQQEQIAKLIEQFEEPELMKIRITGYADDVGDKAFNLKLSEQRAKSVSKYIQAIGVQEKHLEYDGKGVSTGSMAQHQKRRVEIIILNY